MAPRTDVDPTLPPAVEEDEANEEERDTQDLPKPGAGVKVALNRPIAIGALDEPRRQLSKIANQSTQIGPSGGAPLPKRSAPPAAPAPPPAKPKPPGKGA